MRVAVFFHCSEFSFIYVQKEKKRERLVSSELVTSPTESGKLYICGYVLYTLASVGQTTLSKHVIWLVSFATFLTN